ncbi:hypothetical protein [Apilactobacillus micheneri]|uniref:hypothetical protein n=1 Tax=Apilactobacillus micheneri TaxID=1899430 RepID=UPI000D047646|nr:hypothetical protein [Apilactobacillus micheneri]
MIDGYSRLNDIEVSDNRDKQFINYAYKQGFNEFQSIFMYFFNSYSNDSVLSTSEMRSLCNNKDFKLWKQYINKYENQLLTSDSAKYRLQKAKAIAGNDKQQLLNALTLIVITATSLVTSNYLQGSMAKEYKDTFNYKSLLSIKAGYKTSSEITDSDLKQEAGNLINGKYYGLTADQHIWLRSDELNGQVQSAINAALTKGADQKYMDNKLFNYIPSNRNQSANTSFTKTGNTISNVLVPDQKARMESGATDKVFSNYGVDTFDYATQGDGKVCDPCIDRANNSPWTYATDEGSLHTGDRCYRIPVKSKY